MATHCVCLASELLIFGQSHHLRWLGTASDGEVIHNCVKPMQQSSRYNRIQQDVRRCLLSAACCRKA